jgi:hypothetical protein
MTDRHKFKLVNVIDTILFQTITYRPPHLPTTTHNHFRTSFSKLHDLLHLSQLTLTAVIRKVYEDRNNTFIVINPLTPELNPSAQRCLTRFFTGDFAS